MERSALLIALPLVPVPPWGTRAGLERSAEASVVTDSDAYVSAALHPVALASTNAWTADALRVGHQHPGDLVLHVQASLVETPVRFRLLDATASIASGEGSIVQITDDEASASSHTVQVRLDITMLHGEETGGQAQREREIVVNIE